MRSGVLNAECVGVMPSSACTAGGRRLPEPGSAWTAATAPDPANVGGGVVREGPCESKDSRTSAAFSVMIRAGLAPMRQCNT